ncbi:MAG: hypothetical protein H0T92_10490 [Pyrinomonadaceae bacterium]|nr:hypothetical protein [Pyrinomonadaceae bacterium]
MEKHEIQFGETGDDEVRRLRDLVIIYEARFAATAVLVENVRHGTDVELTKIFGQIQLFLHDDLDANAQHRVKKMAVMAAHIRDLVGLLREVHEPHNNTNETGEVKTNSPAGKDHRLVSPFDEAATQNGQASGMPVHDRRK